MQALSCSNPSAMAASGGSTAVVELEKAEIAKTATDRSLNMIRKPDIGTPSRVPVDSSGQRLCSTPKTVRVARNLSLQTPKNARALKTHPSPAPRILEPAVTEEVVENQAASPPKETAGALDLVLDSYTIYANPSFEPVAPVENPSKPLAPVENPSKPLAPVENSSKPLAPVGTPSKEPKQPSSCIPVDSTGQKLCPTPKTGSSPGASKLRFPKATSFQPLETIRSPSVRKEQAKGVLADSNGQRKVETPKLSKQFTTPRGERSAAFGSTCAENLTPRALFSEGRPRTVTSAAKKAVVKKRVRGEEEEDEQARVTRSKTEAERIAIFLRSPAARVRPDGRKEEYRFGVSDALVEKYSETTKLLLSASKPKCPCPCEK